MRLFIILLIYFSQIYAFEVGHGKSIVIVTNSHQGTLSDGNRTLTLLPHPNHKTNGFVILPIDYHATLGKQELQWRGTDTNLVLDLDTVQVSYPVETLSVDSTKVTPPLETLERIAIEKTEAEKIYATTTPKRYWNKPFIRPIDSNTTSEYGSQRTYNGTLKSYHGGVDFRARTPLPILASNDGTVVLAKDRYYSGGTVIIDHGEGLYTCYFHFSRLNVKAGEMVQRGQAIGLSGATGRITGPHLHFGIMIHGIQTDPIDLLTQINKLFGEQEVF
jgi:murein DD-endopeptidase MepM/ murein hydrolase activator NlpD